MALQKTTTADFKMYVERGGRMQFVGNTTDVTLPEIGYATESINFSGMGGTVDFPNHNNLEAMTLEFGNTVDGQITAEIQAPGVRTIELRWVFNALDTETMQLKEDEHRLVMKVMSQKYTAGKVERGSAMDAKNTFSVLYAKKIMNGVEIYEIDVMNHKLVFGGVDYSARLNEFLG